MLAKSLMLTAAILASVHFPARAQARAAQAQSAQVQNPARFVEACQDWRADLGFDAAVAEFLRHSVQSQPDASCLAQAGFNATEELFRPGQEGLYESRLKTLAERFAIGDEKTKMSIEDLNALFQHRWFTESYDALSKYNSSVVAQGAAVGSAAIMAVIAGALMFHNPVLEKISGSSRSMYLRMFRYLALYIGNELGTTVIKHSSETKFRKLKPPMDFFGLDKSYFNYSDLAFLKDMAGLFTNATTYLITHQLVSSFLVWGYRLLGSFGQSVQVVAKPSIVGFLVGWYVGGKVESYADEKITKIYHERSKREIDRMLEEISKPGQSDWRRYTLASKISSAGMQWVSVQDLPLRESVLEEMAAFRQQQICARLNRRMPWQPEIMPSDKFLIPDERFLKGMIEAGERRMRKRLEVAINKRKARLELVREGIVKSQTVLASLGSPYLSGFAIQHQALIDRLDQYLVRNPMLDSHVESVRAVAAQLDPKSDKWYDFEFLKTIARESGCEHLINK